MKKIDTYKNEFSKKGYVVIKNFLKKKEVEEFNKYLFITYSKKLNRKIDKKNIHNILKKLENNKMYDQLYKALKSYNKTIPFKNIAKRLNKYSKLIFKNNFKYAATGMAVGIGGSKRTSYEWHQEKPYYKNDSTIHYQFPILLPCNKLNGTMSVLVGSNRLGFIKRVNNKKLSKKSINSFIPKNINSIKSRFYEKFINMKLKDIVLFSENIIHRTNKNTSNKVRFAGIIRLKKI